MKEDEKEQWNDTRVLIVDECSFAAPNDFDKIYDKTGELCGRRFDAYGPLNVVWYAGDYSQLEPCGAEPIYTGGETTSFHGTINT